MREADRRAQKRRQPLQKQDRPDSSVCRSASDTEKRPAQFRDFYLRRGRAAVRNVHFVLHAPERDCVWTVGGINVTCARTAPDIRHLLPDQRKDRHGTLHIDIYFAMSLPVICRSERSFSQGRRTGSGGRNRREAWRTDPENKIPHGYFLNLHACTLGTTINETVQTIGY